MVKLLQFKWMLLLCALVVGSVSAWATTYKLTQVTTVSAGNKYVFARNGKALSNSVSSKAIQTTQYSTSGLTGTEAYVWTLEAATNGFYLMNVSLTSNQYLNNPSSTTMAFGSKSSNWTFAFTNGVALISNYSNSNRFIGETSSGSNAYKAYATDNLSSYGHDITVYTLEEETTTPSINASNNVDILADATSGEIPYTISNPVANTSLTASVTAGDNWLSNPVVDATNNKVTFTTTENPSYTDTREGTIHLVYGNNLATKDITITQAVAIHKYTVTIETPSNGTLVVKNGETTVSSGDKIADGTTLNITATPEDGYRFKNWQAVDGSYHTYTANFTYTINAHDVTIKANFELIPSHTAEFYDNGIHLDAYDETYTEGEVIIFPDDPTPAVSGYRFIGWATSEINGITTEAPTIVTAATMGTANVTYYAVYRIVENVTAIFDASNISNLTETATRTWTDNATGIELYISNGQRYTGGSPYTWTVTKSTASNDYYMSIKRTDCLIKKIEVTLSGADYVVDAYYAYTSADNTTGQDLTDDVTNEGVVYTWVLNGDYEKVILWSGYDYQTRATKIEVDAIIPSTSYLTSFPTTATITLNAACTDGDMVYGTFSCSKPFVVSSDIEVSEISVVNDRLSLTSYSTGDVVPANTGVLVAALEGGNYTVNLANTAGTSVLGDDNRLRPSGDAGITAAAMGDADANCQYYRLTMHGYVENGDPGTIGFWWGADNGGAFAVAANKAYLAVPEAKARTAGFSLFGDGEATGISATLKDNGEKDNTIYNLNGQRVSKPTKGLYIVNGKKTMVK